MKNKLEDARAARLALEIVELLPFARQGTGTAKLAWNICFSYRGLTVLHWMSFYKIKIAADTEHHIDLGGDTLK